MFPPKRKGNIAIVLVLPSGFRRAMRTTVRTNVPAYGYSVTITATFGVLGVAALPVTTWRVFLFGIGAAVGFTLFDVFGSRFFKDRGRPDPPQVVLLGAAMSIVSIAGGVGAVAALAQLSGSWVAWLLGPLVATTVYLLLVTIELLLARRAAEE